MESGDADFIMYQAPSTPDEVLEEVFRKMEEQLMTKELNCGNYNSDDSNAIVSTEHIRLLPTHQDALQYVSQLITYSSHQPQFVSYLFHLCNSINAQWIAAQLRIW
jgi:hypothetical protein